MEANPGQNGSCLPKMAAISEEGGEEEGVEDRNANSNHANSNSNGGVAMLPTGGSS